MLTDQFNPKPFQPFKFGDRLADKTTGFTGTVTSICEYSHDPRQYLLEDVDSTGRPISQWVSENRLRPAIK